MGSVVGYALVSLDGVAESPETFIDTWDGLMDANLAQVISTQDAVILGRRQYDEWSAVWPQSTMEPFASFINGVAKYVVSSTPVEPSWGATTSLSGDLEASVRAVQRSVGGDVGVHGSISLMRSMLELGLIDELRLVVIPSVAGHGRRLLDAAAASTFELVHGAATPSGALLLHYRLRR